MITLNEIKKSITRKLGTGIPDLHIITEDISQISDVEHSKLFPLLYVQLQPMGSGPASGAKTLARTILVDITYMEETVSSNTAMYDVLDSLQAALGFYLQVEDRFLKIEQFSPSIADDLAHLTFIIDFNDGLPWPEEQLELFGELTISDF